MELRLKKVKQDLRRNVSARYTEEEYNNVLQKAFVYTNGNVSEWIRYASQHCTPRARDLESEKKKKK